MADKLFNIVFNGEFVKGVNESAVKANVGKLFGVDEKQLAVIFSGKRVVLKKQIASGVAIKYRGKLKQAGIVTAIEPVSPEAVASDAGAPETSAAGSNTESNVDNTAPPPSVEVANKGVDWVIAPVGVQMSEAVDKNKIPAAPDVSHISVAPVGSDILTEKKQVVPVEVDISNLSIVPDE